MTKKGIIFIVGLGLLAVYACTSEDDGSPYDQQSNMATGNPDTAGTVPLAGTNANDFTDPANTNVPPTSGASGAEGSTTDLAGTGGIVVAGSGGVVAGSGGIGGVGGVVAGSGGVVAGSGEVVAGSGEVVAGSGGEVIAGSGGGDVGGTGGTPDIRPPCLKDPSQVVLLGDSYMNAPSFVGQAVVAAAVADGALQPGQTYADYSFPGTLMLNGQIPGQLDQALAANPNVKTYIADGCGNDIIGSLVCLLDGSSTNPVCTDIVAQCTQAFKDMGQRAQAAGVTDAIIFMYPDNVPGGGGEIARYGIEQGKTATAEYSTPEFRGYFVDTIPLMQDHPDWYSDLIHVNQQGAKLIGDAIYQVMKDNCIAQPESSGCCEPW